MKVLVFLTLIVSIGMASESIPFENVRQVVDRFAHQRFGACHLDEVLTYYGFDEQPNAYALIYRNSTGEPFTVVAGARWTCTPISEYARALPNYYRNLEKAKVVARSVFDADPVFEKIYYWGPEEEYFQFSCQEQEVLVNSYSMRAFDGARLKETKPSRDAELEAQLRLKWLNYMECPDFRIQYTGYVPDVPYCFWSYGCTPTASAMMFWYWDINGYGDLVDHFFDRWDNVEQEFDYNLPNVQRQLAISMVTESLTQGGTNPSMIRPGHLSVANVQHNYSFSASQSPFGNSGNQFLFPWIKTEIDAGRPTHWAVLNYYYGGELINHSVCAVGYDIVLPDTFVVIHNTWYTGEYSWALWTYHNGSTCQPLVVTLVPGGSNPDNIDLTWPTGQATWMFRGLNYEITWESQGSGIDHIKMWLAPGEPGQGYDSTYWTVLENSVPNTGSYIFSVPNDTMQDRVNLVALDGSNTRLCADGSYASFHTKSVIASNVNLYGHNLMQGNAQDILAVGDYAYVALGDYGIGVVDISDSTLPTVVNTVTVGGSPTDLFYDGQYLYCATYTDSGFYVLSLGDPVNPSVVGSTHLANQTFGFCVDGDYAYVGARTSGIRVVDVSTPNSPGEVGYYDSQGQTYDACMVNDTVLVVADGTRDLLFLNVSNPFSPDSLTSFSTPGIPKGVFFDGYLFVGDGPGGVGIVDVSDPAQPDSVGWFNSPGQMYNGARLNNTLYMGDGPSGLRVLDISNPGNPSELGYLDSYGNANAVYMLSSTLFIMADGDDGFYFMGSTVGVEEYSENSIADPIFALAPNPFTSCITMTYTCTRRERIQVAVYDVLGTRVRLITDQVYNPGTHEFLWNGKDSRGRSVAHGVYFIELLRDGQKHSNKVIYVH